MTPTRSRTREKPPSASIVSQGGHHMELTRRHVLAGAAGIATAPLLPAISAHAAAPMADKQAPSFYRYKVGDVQVNAIFDGSTTFALDEKFVPNAKLDDVQAALDNAFLPKDKMT